MLAAINALHAEASTPQATNWHQIPALYDTLVRMTPSVVIDVNRDVAVALARGPRADLEMLVRLESQADDYYPYHAARADVLRRLNQREPAADAYERASALCSNRAERTYLKQRLDEISGE